MDRFNHRRRSSDSEVIPLNRDRDVPQIEISTDSNNISNMPPRERSSLYDIDDSNSFSKSRILPKLTVHTDLRSEDDLMNILQQPSPHKGHSRTFEASSSPASSRSLNARVPDKDRIPFFLDEEMDYDLSEGLNLALAETSDLWMPLSDSSDAFSVDSSVHMRTGHSHDLESGLADIEMADLSGKLDVPESANTSRFDVTSGQSGKSQMQPVTPTSQISSVLRNFSRRLNARGDEHDGEMDLTDDVDLSERRDLLEDDQMHWGKYSEYEDGPGRFPHSKNNLVASQSLQTTVLLPSEQDDDSLQETLEEETPRLYGKSLGIFGPNSNFRIRCLQIACKPICDQVIASLLIMQTILLTIQQWYVEAGYVHNGGWTWVDYILHFHYMVYTAEIVVKSVAFGFFDDSQMFKELKLEQKESLLRKYLRTAREKLRLTDPKAEDQDYAQSRPLRTVTVHGTGSESVKRTRAFLRSDWHKVDFVSVVSFWISMFLSINKLDITHQCMIFRSLMCLKILRLLNITHGTRLILKSLRKAGHQASDATMVLCVFWLLFAIIGVQSFKSSLRRHCVWTNPTNNTDIYENSMQFCGSYLDPTTLKKNPYIPGQNNQTFPYVKGFACPVYSKCITGENPYGNTISFDNIFISIQMVFVVISANTFSDIMYYTMDSDDMAASLYYIFAILILVVWLLSLIVAVIINCYRVHIEDMRKARQSRKTRILAWEFDFRAMDAAYEDFVTNHSYLRKFCSLRSLFNILVIVDLINKALVFPDFNDRSWARLRAMELGVTLCLFAETAIKMALFGRKIKVYFYSLRNIIDLLLAISTMVVANVKLNPQGAAYGWTSVLFIFRFYRLLVARGLLHNAWKAVFSSFWPFIDLGIFFILLLYLMGIICSRLFEGLIPVDEYLDSDQLIMYNLPNVVLSLYTITTTENWTSILYLAQQCSRNTFTKVCVAVYLIGWFIFSNMVVLNIFIAIITQNLGVNEANKKRMQIKQFYQKLVRELNSSKHVGLFDDLRSQWFRSTRKRAISTSQMIEHMSQILEKSNMSPGDFLESEKEIRKEQEQGLFSRCLKLLRKWKPYARLEGRITGSHFFVWLRDWVISATTSKVDFSLGFNYKELDVNAGGKSSTREVFRLFDESNLDPDKELKQRAYLEQHVEFNRTLHYFYPNHPLRRFCQRIVSPAYGKRLDGVDPHPKVRDAFYVLMFFATVLIVVMACYVTPLYRKENLFYEHPWNWATEVDLVFSILFTLEFLIKVIADGFARTPNAYLRSAWDAIDFVVLISFWITTFGEMFRDFNLVVIVGEARALRGLRLLTITRRSKEYFNYAVISGARKMLGAVLIAMTLLLPFSLWGLQLFVGKLAKCSDSSSDYDNCILEYSNEVFKWEVLSPKAYVNPYLNFDDFGNSLSSLFQIISLEGWTDLLLNLMNITVRGQPPKTFASPGNGFFVIIFIFCSIVIILNLFVSVIINNYSVQTGTAFLNDKQRAWYEVKRVLSHVHPSKRKDESSMNSFRKAYYHLVVNKNRTYTHIVNGFYFLHVLGLLVEFYPANRAENNFRYVITTFSTTGLACDTVLTLYALGPRLFVRNGWNISRLIIVVGACVMSGIAFFVSRQSVYANVNKLFLVGVLLLLIPRVETFNQLFRYASASLPTLLALIYTWLVLFLVYAIALNQVFGLTRLGENTTGNLNCRTVTKSLIMLFRMSFGEGWNYIMEDFRIGSPNCFSAASRYSSDCGENVSAHILFFSWNILSMYIFLNILISVVINSFSYVYNSSGPHSLLTREEIRKFKRSWREFDPDGSGFIDPSQLQPFLSSLDGVLSYKVYPEKFSIPNITSQWITKHSNNPYQLEYDFEKLDEIMATIDFRKVKERRRRYNRLIIEAYLKMVQTSDGPKIEFTKLLLQIGYYSRFQDSTCLTLEDFVKRYVLIQKINKVARKLKIEATIQMVLSRLRLLIGNLNQSSNIPLQRINRRVATEIFDQDDIYGTHGDDYDNPFNNNELYRSVSETSLNPFNDPFSDPIEDEQIVPPASRRSENQYYS
ncbi:hypothetical protein KL950_001797 [Ogataea haglerorum]|nr:hypothetical protein KL915_002133 [Ogataea haglerorum]KAG7709578.1 hypothetical protein KL950_001797 [Ogataea haglerorum]